MIDLIVLMEILERSVEKNGEKPLTNLWLLNILKMVENQMAKNEEQDSYGYCDSDWGNN
jgi:hypothetical protein